MTQLSIDFPPTVIFWSHNGANYAAFPEDLLVRENVGILEAGKKYTKIGSKARTAFHWKAPIEYTGTVKDGPRYLTFGASPMKGKPGQLIAYAFPIVSVEPEFCVLQFTVRMNACRDIIIDEVQ